MSDSVYLDTRPGESCFSAPKGEPDYLDWLLNKYKKQHYIDGESKCCFGLAQKIQEIIQAKNPPKVVILGVAGPQLAKFILVTASEHGKDIEVEVISGNE
ncbi:MAG: hypothetical protein OEX07_15550 [Gammaproteobacteria bacterium]|nr:hypothetical protein [Gammaproteobacteria bacterium]